MNRLVVEFCVTGRPVSYQTHNRHKLREWVRKVRSAARKRWRGSPLRRDVVVRIICYFFSPPDRRAGDPNNLEKPILDALEGVIYDDDSRARSIGATVTCPSSLVVVHREGKMSDHISDPAILGLEFVLVKVEEPTEGSECGRGGGLTTGAEH